MKYKFGIGEMKNLGFQRPFYENARGECNEMM
jgi:hypothetical protein